MGNPKSVKNAVMEERRPKEKEMKNEKVTDAAVRPGSASLFRPNILPPEPAALAACTTKYVQCIALKIITMD